MRGQAGHVLIRKHKEINKLDPERSSGDARHDEVSVSVNFMSK